MECKICNSRSKNICKKTIMNKYDISYFLCDTCGFIQTEQPYWLKEAYADPINTSDTGILSRNISLSKATSNLIYFLFDKNAPFLDYAGGYGIFTRLMRDIGFDFYWHDPYCENLFAKGFECHGQQKRYELLTCFEAFEHFQDPGKETQEMLKRSDNILFSTELLPKGHEPGTDDWCYYGLEHGQHISFYSIKSLAHLAKRFNCNLYSDGTHFHLLTKKSFNPLIFKLLSKKYIDFLIFQAIRLGLSSKTEQDSRLLSKGLKKEG